MSIQIAPEHTVRTSEAEMLELLRQKYTRIRRGTAADRYVRAAHVRAPIGYGVAKRIADYIVIDTYGQGRLIGHEVKVSRADWLRELREPDKAVEWQKHCHSWYLVVHDTAIIKDHELPESWGLMAPDSAGNLRVRTKAPEQAASPIGLQQIGQLTRAVAQTRAQEMRKS